MARDLARLTQDYRNRADAENMFDELKNQWGWTGYTTRDTKRSQLMARLVALVYNWWGIYGLAVSDVVFPAAEQNAYPLEGERS